MESGIERGIEQGIERGLEAKGLEVALNALAEGFTVEQVHKITGLDLETIAGLRASV